ncbi:MAG: ATP synthase subunit I [Tepidibacillus sp.]
MGHPSMSDFKARIIRIVRYTLILLSLFMIGVITPYSAIFLGLALGLAVGLLNLLHTAWKVNRIGEMAIKVKAQTRKRPMFVGMFTRFATSILAIMLVFQYPEQLHLVSTVIGLFLIQIVTIVDGIINSIREKNKISTGKG